MNRRAFLTVLAGMAVVGGSLVPTTIAYAESRPWLRISGDGQQILVSEDSGVSWRTSIAFGPEVTVTALRKIGPVTDAAVNFGAGVFHLRSQDGRHWFTT